MLEYSKGLKWLTRAMISSYPFTCRDTFEVRLSYAYFMLATVLILETFDGQVIGLTCLKDLL